MFHIGEISAHRIQMLKSCFTSRSVLCSCRPAGLLFGYLEVRALAAVDSALWKQGTRVSTQMEGRGEHVPAGSGD